MTVRPRKNEPVQVVAAIDDGGKEALYIGGKIYDIEGDTIYAIDIATAVGDSLIQFSHVEVIGDVGEWPDQFDALIPRTRQG